MEIISIYLCFHSIIQYRNMTTVLTREYLDVRPKGWVEYAAKRIAQLYTSWHFLSFEAVLYFYYVLFVASKLKSCCYISLNLFLLGELINATTGLFAKSTLIWSYQLSLLFIPSSSINVLLLETLEIFWRQSLEGRLIVTMLSYETMKLLSLR